MQLTHLYDVDIIIYAFLPRVGFQRDALHLFFELLVPWWPEPSSGKAASVFHNIDVLLAFCSGYSYVFQSIAL